VTHEVVDPGLVPVQAAALRQHVTQVTVADSGDTYALSNDIAARIPGREGFALLDPATGRLLRSEPSSGPTPEPTSEPTSGVPGGGVATTRHTGLLGAR
jgi:N-acetyl-1-D-myo-inositol-2-amino-2-deoxy-alpha-D-glucopyranoside deacetylase